MTQSQKAKRCIEPEGWYPRVLCSLHMHLYTLQHEHAHVQAIERISKALWWLKESSVKLLHTVLLKRELPGHHISSDQWEEQVRSDCKEWVPQEAFGTLGQSYVLMIMAVFTRLCVHRTVHEKDQFYHVLMKIICGVSALLETLNHKNTNPMLTSCWLSPSFPKVSLISFSLLHGLSDYSLFPWKNSHDFSFFYPRTCLTTQPHSAISRLP